MKALKSWQWQKTDYSEYKSILGFDQVNQQWKIVLTHKGYEYSFCPGSGESDSVDLFLDDNILYVYSEDEHYGYAGLESYIIDRGIILETDFSSFLQSDWEFMSIMDSSSPNCIDKYFNYSTMHKVKMLAAYEQQEDILQTIEQVKAMIRDQEKQS